MAYVDIPGGLFMPKPVTTETAPGLASVLLDANGEYAGCFIRAPLTGTITKIGFATRTVTTGGDLDIRLETQDTSTGRPSGTLWGTNTNFVRTMLATDDNNFFEVTLTAGASVTKGNLIAIRVERVTGGTFVGNIGRITTAHMGWPGSFSFLGGTFASTAALGGFSVYYDGVGYPPTSNLAALTAVAETTFSTSSGTKILGNVFTPPVDMKVDGMWAQLDADSAVDMKLFDTDGATVLRSVRHNTNDPVIATAALSFYNFAEVELLAGQNYRIAAVPTTTTNSSTPRYTFSTSSMREQFCMGGAYMLGSTSTTVTPASTSDWTDGNTTVHAMGLVASAFHDGSGGGGGLAANIVRGFIA